jgi:phosphoribosylformimino-5-aminoimidazole carboxamide ribotide isomerase
VEIYPAIDLRQGQVVRLRYGDPRQQTTFAHDPVAVAHQWAAAGARWLHVVNLDGALGGDDEATAANLAAVDAIARIGPRVQFGGGLRSLNDVTQAFELGAGRVVLGTMAVVEPEMLRLALAKFGPERIVVGLDARDGRVAIRGWQADSGLEVVATGRQLRAAGVTTVLHTDIGRDGDLSGVNGAASSALAQATGLDVIASGGVSGPDDVRGLIGLPGISGVIIGRALYEGKIDLAELLREVGRD